MGLGMTEVKTNTEFFKAGKLPSYPPFPVPDYLRDSIASLIDAIEHDREFQIPMWEEQIRADSRGLADKRQMMWVIDYYHSRGWLRDSSN